MRLLYKYLGMCQINSFLDNDGKPQNFTKAGSQFECRNIVAFGVQVSDKITNAIDFNMLVVFEIRKYTRCVLYQLSCKFISFLCCNKLKNALNILYL